MSLILFLPFLSCSPLLILGLCWNPPSRLCFSQVRYRAEWSSVTAFNSVLISPHMLVDHMPDVVHKALLSLTQERHSSLCPSSASNAHLNVIWAPTASDPEMTVVVKSAGGSCAGSRPPQPQPPTPRAVQLFWFYLCVRLPSQRWWFEIIKYYIHASL